MRAEAPGSDGLHGVGMRRDVGTVREAGSPGVRQGAGRRRRGADDREAAMRRGPRRDPAVKGIDMVQFGPADYAMSIGLAGQWSHPDVVKAERLTIETALKLGIHPRVEIGEPAAGRTLPGDGREALLPGLGCRYPA